MMIYSLSFIWVQFIYFFVHRSLSKPINLIWYKSYNEGGLLYVYFTMFMSIFALEVIYM